MEYFKKNEQTKDFNVKKILLSFLGKGSNGNIPLPPFY